MNKVERPKAERRLAHRARMAERRIGQHERKPDTLIITRAQLRAIISQRRAAMASVNVERAKLGEPPMAGDRPAVHIIFASRYMPHQGKRECARRAAPRVQLQEAA